MKNLGMKKAQKYLAEFWAWLTNDDQNRLPIAPAQYDDLAWGRALPFLFLHLGCFLVLWVGVSSVAVMVALLSYVFRMFFITAFYHRYFSHRSFKLSRPMQFAFAFVGCMAGQRGPIWWAAHHREHHKTSDTPDDPHSPLHRGFWFSHTFWFLTKGRFFTPKQNVKDLLRYPELVWLERFDWVPFILFGYLCFLVGEWLGGFYQTDGYQTLAWGFFISTTLLYHATYTINSLAHKYGSRRFATADQSRNNFWLALLTMGEGWHNNHHRYPNSARQGFYWWEFDPSYWLLRLLSALDLVKELRTVPASVFLDAQRQREQRL